MLLSFPPSPLQKIESSLLAAKQVELFIKRDDLIHPQIQGNKWRKLKYNLHAAKELNQQTLLTFGGPYSNHIYALAAAGQHFGFKTIGIIRGEQPKNLSPTLQFAVAKNMQLHFVSRNTYRLKESADFIENLQARFGNFYLVPEGGTNVLAVKGTAEIIDEIDIEFDYICTACGTGGTLAGLVAGLNGEKQTIGFSALKGDDVLTGKINELTTAFNGSAYQNFSINFDYHCGGYAKITPQLIDFIKHFKQQFNIQLEPVYTGKMLFGLLDLIGKDYFAKGSRIIALHTGGLQGLSGYTDYFPELFSEFSSSSFLD